MGECVNSILVISDQVPLSEFVQPPVVWASRAWSLEYFYDQYAPHELNIT